MNLYDYLHGHSMCDSNVYHWNIVPRSVKSQTFDLESGSLAAIERYPSSVSLTFAALMAMIVFLIRKDTPDNPVEHGLLRKMCENDAKLTGGYKYSM